MNFARFLNQTCVYWPPLTPDGWGGSGSVPSGYPVEIACRWEAKREEFVTEQGEEAVSRAVVFLASDVEAGGWLYLGDLDGLDSGDEDDPKSVDGSYPVRTFEKTPDLKGASFLRKAVL